MGLSKNNQFSYEDLFEQAKFIDGLIKKMNAKRVLELASGRGINSSFLARKNPSCNFVGIDISETHLRLAKKRFQNIRNCSFLQEDFHNLKKFRKNSFDIVFVIEALCHSEKKQKVLKEVRRVLRPKGLMIIFDGYIDYSKIKNKKQDLACRLIAKSTAVDRFADYTNLMSLAKNHRFTIKKSSNLSDSILPTLRRFERLAKYYFRFPALAKLINHILPKEFTYNTLYGYLTPTLIKMRLATYKLTVLQKSSD